MADAKLVEVHSSKRPRHSLDEGATVADSPIGSCTPSTPSASGTGAYADAGQPSGEHASTEIPDEALNTSVSRKRRACKSRADRDEDDHMALLQDAETPGASSPLDGEHQPRRVRSPRYAI